VIGWRGDSGAAAAHRSRESILSVCVLRFNTMKQASVNELPIPLRVAAVGIAERIRDGGGRAWLVGGATRDLVLGNEPIDIDMATELVPERIEALFEQTVGVGKAFGTMIVQWKGTGVEVTTFRSERGYSDGRRPDEVTYGSSVEEDAARRDFTCNALYLDPLTGEFRDPEQGLDDLAAGRLRCVGDPRERFREDGLRILRFVRFAARLGLAPDPATEAGARAELEALRGVSAERLRREFEGMLNGPAPSGAFAHLRELGADRRCLPGWLDGRDGDARLGTLAALGPACGPELGFAAVLDPAPCGDGPGDSERSLAALEALRPAKDLRRAVGQIWSLQVPLERAARGEATRPERLRLFRDASWEPATRFFRARGVGDASSLDRLEAELADLRPEELRPLPLLTAPDLIAAGVPRGPRLGELLSALEDQQLAGRVVDREGAEGWLADQLGGNQRRSDHETG